jgi:GT2 family glycosyltransferase
VAVVVITRDRHDELLETLDRLCASPEKVHVVVVDNGSRDGTAPAVRARFPDVTVVRSEENLGGGGRNVGARLVDTPYVAFCDDDTWWAAGSLTRAADLLDRHPDVAVLAARVIVEPDGRLDPVCELMGRSPLNHRADLPGPRVRGFLACSAVVRRVPFLDAGGFDPRFVVGGEEELLAWDLAGAGWELVYVDQLQVHHRPSTSRDPAARRRREHRNMLWTNWLRRPRRDALTLTVDALRRSLHDRDARAGCIDAARSLGWVLRNRRAVGEPLAGELRLLDRQIGR